MDAVSRATEAGTPRPREVGERAVPPRAESLLHGARVTLVPLHREVLAPPAGAKALPAFFAAQAARARVAHLKSELGVERTSSLEYAADPRMRELGRLMLRGPRGFAAYLEPGSGVVTLYEPTSPVRGVIAAGVDRVDNLRRLVALFEDRAAPGKLRAVAELVSERLPTDVLRAVSAARLDRAAFLPNPRSLSPAMTHAPEALCGLGTSAGGLLGVGVAAALGLSPAESAFLGTALGAGAFTALLTGHRTARLVEWWTGLRRISLAEERGRVGVVEAATRQVRTSYLAHAELAVSASVMTHELMHVLDRVLGAAGPASEEPELQRLYRDAKRADEEGRPTPAYPTKYGGTNAAEFFAEGATVYLGLHAQGWGVAIGKTTRGDLLARNPELHRYFEQLFAARLPAALTAGALCPSDEWVWIDRSFDEASAVEPHRRCFEDWASVAVRHLMTARDARDPAALAAAHDAIDWAKARPNATDEGQSVRTLWLRRLRTRASSLAADLARA